MRSRGNRLCADGMAAGARPDDADVEKRRGLAVRGRRQCAMAPRARRRRPADHAAAVSPCYSGAREARTSDVQLHIRESRDSRSGPSDHPGMTANWEPRTMTKLSDATRNKLKTISTATVATALFK